MKPTHTQINFCRLTKTSQEDYQTNLFETGCEFAENLGYTCPQKYKEEYIQILLSLPQYWKWWSTQWNIRTQEAFGVVGISENETHINSLEIDALNEAFASAHSLSSYQHIYPNNLVMKALKEKIQTHETTTLKSNTSKGMERNRIRRSRVSVEL